MTEVKGALRAPVLASAPSSPVTGQIYYDSVANNLYVWDGTVWADLTGSYPLLAPLGAVGAPSYSFTGDPNTGMWSSAADTLDFSTGGVSRIEIDSSGKVGFQGAPGATTGYFFRGISAATTTTVNIVHSSTGSAMLTLNRENDLSAQHTGLGIRLLQDRMYWNAGANAAFQMELADTAIDHAWLYDGAAFGSELINFLLDTEYTTATSLNADTNDFLYLTSGNSSLYTGLYFELSTLGAGYTLVWEYSKGGGVWQAFTPTSDGTSNWTASGWVNFGTLSGWAVDTINGVASQFGIRVSTSTGPSTVATALNIGNALFNGHFARWYNADIEKFRVDNQGRLFSSGVFFPGESNGLTKPNQAVQSSRYISDDSANTRLFSNTGFAATKLYSSTAAGAHPTTPDISFTGDPNTGIYSSAADTLDFATNGTQKVSISSAGQVALPVQGATGGLLIGGDASLYRSAAAELTLGSTLLATNIALAGIARGTDIFAAGITTRSVRLDTGRHFQLRWDDNSSGTGPLDLLNLDSTDANSGTQIRSYLSYDGTTQVASSAIRTIKEQLWTSTATTQDTSVQFFTALDGALGEAMRLTSAKQIQLPGQGSTAGLLIGTDANLYRVAAGLQHDGAGARSITIGTTDVTTASVALATVQADTPQLSVYAHGSARTVARFGITLGGWAEISLASLGAGPNGLILGTRTAVPLVFGTNNAEVGRFTSAGLLQLTNAPTVGAPAVGIQARVATLSVKDVGISGQARAGRVFVLADFTTNLGLTAPVGLYNLTDTTDISGNARTLTNVGTVGFGSGVTGAATEAAIFTGTNAKALHNTNAAFQITTGSWGCWFRVAKRGTAQFIVAKWRTSTANRGYAIEIGTDNILRAYASTNGTLTTNAVGVSDIADDRWHFAVATHDGYTTRIYMDGVLEGTVANVGTIFASAATFGIGAGDADQATTLEPFFGKVDEAFVTSDVLSLDQIRYLYAGKIAHTLGVAPNESHVSVTRRRRGGALATGDFPSTPLHLYNFTAGALTDAGSLNNALTNNGTSVACPGADGAQGNAFNFIAASSQYLSVTDTGLPSGTAARSIGAWVKTTDTSGGIVEYGTSATQFGLEVVSGSISCMAAGSGPGIAGYNDGQWHFVVGVYDNGAGDGVKAKLYIDGKLVFSNTLFGSTTLAGANGLRIGNNNTPNLLDGQVDGVFIIGVALTPEQVYNLYAVGSLSMGASPKNAGDHIERVDSSNVYAIFDTIPSQHQIDLKVAA